MPSFSYSLTRGNETKLTMLTKSNPQGWLFAPCERLFLRWLLGVATTSSGPGWKEPKVLRVGGRHWPMSLPTL